MRAGRFARRYALNVAVALDQLVNALLLGDPDETLSSRAAKRCHAWGWRQLGKLLEWIDPGHLNRSIERDEGKDGLL